MKKKSSTYYTHPLKWLLPMLVMLIVFYLYPMIDVIRYSFTNVSILRPTYRYTLDSYVKIMQDPEILHTFYVTFTFVFSNVIAQLVIGMLLALFLNFGIRNRYPLTIAVRTVVLIAWMIPGVLVGIVWRLLLSSSNFGIVNYLLEVFNFNRIEFLVQPHVALVSVIIVNIWRGTAFTMIMEYAGLQRIPEQLYEAAKVDGAGAITQFFRITLPLMKPILFINLVLITIYTFNTFDMILALTGGGPARATEVLTLSAYTQMFKFFSMGTGAAISVILLVINMTMAYVYYRFILSDTRGME